jgi:hypothetical protein
LKLANAAVFAAVVFMADRMLQDDPVARLRALLLWTANPLLMWSLIAAGHLDVLAEAVGLAGLLIQDGWATGRPVLRALAAGPCVGAAAYVEIAYLPVRAGGRLVAARQSRPAAGGSGPPSLAGAPPPGSAAGSATSTPRCPASQPRRNPANPESAACRGGPVWLATRPRSPAARSARVCAGRRKIVGLCTS